MRTALLAVLSMTLGCAHIGGAWTIDVYPTKPISHGPAKITCTFSEDHEKLTGHCSTDSSSIKPPLSGHIRDDRHVTFQIKTGFNQEGMVTFVGELDRHRTITGTYHFDYGDGERRGEFVARKR